MSSMQERLQHYYLRPGGMREVLVMSFPLILGNVSFTVQHFLNRLFLTWYSPAAVAGAIAGTFVTFVLLGFFMGTGEYLTTFVAQYQGAGRPERIGAVMWQGIYFALLSGLAALVLRPFTGALFAFVGHEPQVMGYEVEYTRIVLLATFPCVLMAALSTFFAGRGQTRVVLLVNLLSTALNALLDYLWIFGYAGFPRLGVAGAAWATFCAQTVGASMFFLLMVQPGHRRRYRTLSAWRLEVPLFLRYLRYGLPAGLHFSLEVAAFTVFLLLVGRLGTEALAASGIAFNLNSFVFFPMVGLGTGVSSLVGRYLGEDRPELAERSAWSAFAMSLVYMALWGLLYLLFPGLLLRPYGAGAGADFARVSDIAQGLLRFVAVYSIFDMMNVVFAFGLRGAGDSTFPMASAVVLSVLLMLLPTYVACFHLGGGVYTAWTMASAYVTVQGLMMLRRFRQGRWKSLRVIEPEPALSPCAA